MSGASERANGQASGQVLLSGFLVDLAHSVVVVGCWGVGEWVEFQVSNSAGGGKSCETITLWKIEDC